MKLIITIDTEEDNWGNFNAEEFTVKNIERIPSLQDLFDSFGVKPTYLLSYPVATDDKAASILRAILQGGRCEIGTHCHPWNTPPFEEVTKDEQHSMLCNLPSELQHKKIQTLHHAIQNGFGIDPVSFRAGRWGFDREVAKNIFRLGYRVDTSMTAFTDWTRSFGPDYSDVSPGDYFFSVNDIFKASSNGHLLEVPATVGFLQQNFQRMNRYHKALRRLSKLRVNGLLYRLNLINKVWLSPEMSQGNMMVKLGKRMAIEGYGFINMIFHSPSLIAGLTPFVTTKSDEEEFLKRIEEFLRFVKDAGIESVTLSDALNRSGGNHE